MRAIRRFFEVILALVLLLVLVGFLLPDQTRVERTIVIDAPPQEVYPYLANFRQFNRWSPWAKLDPDTRYTFKGPESGEGAMMSWQSDDPQVGSGSQLIVEAIPPELVRTRLEFNQQGGARATLRISDQGNASEVTWSFDTEWGYNLIGRYMGLMMDSWVGADYEKGLADLKELVESG